MIDPILVPLADIPNIFGVRPDLHRGAPNLTDLPRAMLDQTYRTARAATA